MGICWYCHWGWPKPLADIYAQTKQRLIETGLSEDDAFMSMHYGAAHICWSDENFERAHWQWCLDNYEQHVTDYPKDRDTPERLQIVRESIEQALALPDHVLNVEPEDYDGEHPENFPPPADLPMTRGAGF